MKSNMNHYQLRSVQLETVIENLPHAVIVLDATTRIILANKMAESFAANHKLHLFGLRGGEAFGCVHADNDQGGCGFSRDCKRCHVRKTVETTFHTQKNATNIEATLQLVGKGKKTFSLSTTYLRDGDMVILAMNDITDAKKREEILLHNQKLLAAVETGASVCHEMNQPLTVIAGYIDLLEKNICDKRKHTDYFLEIKKSIGRLRVLSDKLMSLKKYRTTDYFDDTKILDLTD